MKNLDMNACPAEDRLDDYLLNRLNEADRASLEEHFFNCDACFRATVERDALLRALRSKGGELFGPEARPERRSLRSTVGLWLPAAAGAALLIIAALTFIPRFRSESPAFVPPTDDTLRGGAVEIVAPRGTLAAAPAVLEWKAGPVGLDYTVTLRGPGLDWSGRTAESKLAVPEDVRQSIQTGADYTWQVKAFAEWGGLTANSAPVVFRVVR